MQFSEINGETKLVGIMGWPVAHTLSPIMHNAAFRALEMNWRYVPLPVRPADLRDAMVGLRALGFRGANLTVPHKETTIPFLDGIGEAAGAIGAVNTVVVRDDGSLFGENTDAIGFRDDFGTLRVKLAGRKALVLGAGGAARAVVYVLLSQGAEVCILNRSPGRAEHLAAEMAAKLGGNACSGPLSQIAEMASWAEIVIQATQVGMWPASDASVWPDGVPFQPGQVLYDVVYRPEETRIMKQARAGGAMAFNGLGMLLRQGGAAFRLWTGRTPPLEVMEAAVRLGWQ